MNENNIGNTDELGFENANLNQNMNEPAQGDVNILDNTSNNTNYSSYENQGYDDTYSEPQIELLPYEIGRVKDISGDRVIIGITSDLAYSKNLVDHHVVFQIENDLKIVGTLISLSKETAEAQLIGEIKGNRFIAGVLIQPPIGRHIYQLIHSLVITLLFLEILVLVNLVVLQDCFKMFSLIPKTFLEMQACLYLMRMENMKVRYLFKTVMCYLKNIQLM